MIRAIPIPNRSRCWAICAVALAAAVPMGLALQVAGQSGASAGSTHFLVAAHKSHKSHKAKPKSKAKAGSVAMGAKINSTADDVSNGFVIGSATVYGYYANVTSSNSADDPPPSGDTYGVIDVRECGDSNGPSSVQPDFLIGFTNGKKSSAPIGLQGPLSVASLSSESNLGSATYLISTGHCDRGWVVFDVPKGDTPSYVALTWESSQPLGKWAIPANES